MESLLAGRSEKRQKNSSKVSHEPKDKVAEGSRLCRLGGYSQAEVARKFRRAGTHGSKE
jgi:hypothetical protein